jgi:hypothetical protein
MSQLIHLSLLLHDQRIVQLNLGTVLDSLMGCDLGNICARAERETSENVDYFKYIQIDERETKLTLRMTMFSGRFVAPT